MTDADDLWQATGLMFDLLALVLFSTTIYFAWRVQKPNKTETMQRKTEVVTVALLFVFCALMGNPDRFKTFRFSLSGGIETEAREAIQQVQVTLAQLQKMAVASAQANLTELAMSGQMLSGINTDYKFAIRDRIVNSLREIGVSKKEILGTQDVWISVYGRLILNHIEGLAAKLLPKENAGAEIEDLPKDASFDLPSSKAVRDWVAAKSLTDPALTQFVGEYESIWTTGAMKNPSLIQFNESISRP